MKYHIMAMVLFVGVLMFASPMLGCINSGCAQASHNGELMGVDECITDLYVPEYTGCNLDATNYYLAVSHSFHSPTNAFRVRRIPGGCRTAMMRGYFDFSGMATNDAVEYATLFAERHIAAGDMESLVSRIPNVRCLELIDGFPGDSSLSEDALDLGKFLELKALRHLDIRYYGSVSNSVALLDNHAIGSLRLSIGRQLSDVSPNAWNAGAAIPPCVCSGHDSIGGIGSKVKVFKTANFPKGIRNLELVNTNVEAVVLSAIPDCCAGLTLIGRFDLSCMQENRRLQSLFWCCHEAITRQEIEAIPFARFPNLKLLVLAVAAEDECELDFRKIDVCHSLEYVDIMADGNFVVRNIEDAFANKRIWYAFYSIDRRDDSCWKGE